MAIVFFKSGRWSGTNDAVEVLLRREFPDDELVVVDLFAELRRRPAMLARLIAAGLVQLRPPLREGRGEFGFFQFSPLAERTIRSLGRRLAERRLAGRTARFTFQTTSRMRAGLPDVPHFAYIDTTEAMKPILDGRPPSRVERAVRGLEGRLFARSACIFTHTDAAARSLVADYGVAPRRAIAVYGGTNLRPSTPPTREPTRRILFVAVEWRRKGGDVLVDAFARLRSRMPDVELRVAGVDVSIDVPGVVVLGRLPREEIAAELERAAVFCLPSRRDHFPNVIREAMHHGVPVVTTTTAGVAEAAIADGSVVTVPPEDPAALADALGRLLEDPASARDLGDRGRELAERLFTWQSVGETMRRAILDALT